VSSSVDDIKLKGPATVRRIQSLDRALALLDTLRDSRHPLGLKELSNQTGINPATAHLLLRTLAARGYVEQNPDSRAYELGVAVIEGGLRAGQHRTLPALVAPWARRVHRLTAETTMVRIVHDGRICSLLEFESPQAVVVRPGRIHHSELRHGYAFASGKVFLAAMPPAEVQELLGAPPYQAFTPHTLTSYETVAQELSTVRDRGYAWDREEYLEGIRCVAAPLYNSHRRVIAIMSIAAPACRTPAKRLHELTELLIEHAASASARIGAEDLTGRQSRSDPIAGRDGLAGVQDLPHPLPQ